MLSARHESRQGPRTAKQKELNACRRRRQDTWSDLQLFGVVNLIVILAFGWLKTNLVDAVDSLSRGDPASKPLWSSIYEAGLLHFPELQQIFRKNNTQPLQVAPQDTCCFQSHDGDVLQEWVRYACWQPSWAHGGS